MPPSCCCYCFYLALEFLGKGFISSDQVHTAAINHRSKLQLVVCAVNAAGCRRLGDTAIDGASWWAINDMQVRDKEGLLLLLHNSNRGTCSIEAAARVQWVPTFAEHVVLLGYQRAVGAEGAEHDSKVPLRLVQLHDGAKVAVTKGSWDRVVA